MPRPMPYQKNNISEPQIASHDFECDYCACDIDAGDQFCFWQGSQRVCMACAEDLKTESYGGKK